MHFDLLATELVTQIFLSCNSIPDALALSSTCHRFRHVYMSSKNLPILNHAAEAQYGPLEDCIQLLTHNASQTTHMLRDVSISHALLKQIIHVGNIAEKWYQLYPFKKWKYDFCSRRLLTASESHAFRRALYRLWLYTRAFHTPAHTRERRMIPQNLQERAALLHNWSTPELAEIADVHAILRDVLHSNVCPSNGAIARKFRKRHPDQDASQHLLFNIHLNYPPPAPAPTYLSSGYHNPLAVANHYQPNPNSTLPHLSPRTSNANRSSFLASTKWDSNPGVEGWGDDIPHYYIVEDMLKLDPAQILWLKENAQGKVMVQDFVRGLGEWFNNNGETWGQTLEWVLNERGEDVGELLADLAEGVVGIAVKDD
ncbi:hypothetical protein K402DRAFT_378227 [Aulographum hederae CBS 113979]|uniref:F-box domain-containing protein n=1 Tax=Aulographum hederae CBS 113979 TaxID=1176131 RepID=A0A6G1GYF8_9PEZI|nr:hypothetical protein K402DRAFT_378227 [Aulographum hederae CBS 113979]